MLRLFSSKIFREDLNDYALPIYAFEDFEDIKGAVNMKNGTYKFCLPVSIGDFPEVNVPACFSSTEEELRKFVEIQKDKMHRRAFILSDFQVSNLSDLWYSGTISVFSKKGLYDYYNQSTTVALALKNPILTYAEQGISPRDLPPDIELSYNHVFNDSCAFGKIERLSSNVDLDEYKNIIYQAYLASIKIHQIVKEYDGDEYSEHALFFVDDQHKIHLYEIVGEDSFLCKASKDDKMIRAELDFIKSYSSNIEESKEEGSRQKKLVRN